MPARSVNITIAKAETNKLNTDICLKGVPVCSCQAQRRCAVWGSSFSLKLATVVACNYTVVATSDLNLRQLIIVHFVLKGRSTARKCWLVASGGVIELVLYHDQ